MSYKQLTELLPKRFMEYMRMGGVKMPVFLNTPEKYNKVIRKTDTVKKYEELFYRLLGDDTVRLLDILQVMKAIERDVIMVHGITDITHLLDLTESLIRYMIAMTEESEKQKKKEGQATNSEEEKQRKKKPQTNSAAGEGYDTCDCDRLHNEPGINTC